jgi:uracil-DNA glycosylase
MDADALKSRIRACRLCAGDFAATKTAHAPRPVAWFRPGARRSGDRLRDWLGLSRAEFYDTDRVAIVPMAFCFPGYDARGSDLPPPRRCAETWRAAVLAHLPDIRTTVVIGAHAQRWHLGPQAARAGVIETLRNWRAHAPGTFVLPHPSWRNTAVLRRNPWIEAEILPALRQRVREIL